MLAYGQSFPSLLSMMALYKLLSPMGLINTKTGLIIVYTGTMAVFALWNMKGYFDTIPIEIEEAARINGTTHFQLVQRIVLPLAKPTIAVTAMMILIIFFALQKNMTTGLTSGGVEG